MKRKNLLITALIIVSITIVEKANARIWRVNLLSNYNGTTLWGDNLGGTVINPVFSQLKQANDLGAVAAGDTLHLEGAALFYDLVEFTKKLTVIGPGYALSDNPNTSVNLLSANVAGIAYKTGSAGSQLIGVTIPGNNSMSIDVSNIVIKRCKIDYLISINFSNSILSDIFILQNLFFNASNTSEAAIRIYFPIANFVFNNNICRRPFLLWDYSSNVFTAQECKNNVFDFQALDAGKPAIRLLCNNFQNNILKTPAATVLVNNGIASSRISNNISSSTTDQFGTANGNIVVVDQSQLFVTSASTDGKYQLKAGSLGSNNGTDNTDRGVFGGAASNKYTLSGLPPVPVIYDIITSGVSDASGLPVTIKARTIK